VPLRPRLLNERDAAAYIGRAPTSLRNLRSADAKRLANGEKPLGPTWVKVGRSPMCQLAPGTMSPSRYRNGISSPNRIQASSLTSASPGSRLLLPQRVPPSLISRLPAAPQIFPQTSPKRGPTLQRGSHRSRLSLDQPSGTR